MLLFLLGALFGMAVGVATTLLLMLVFKSEKEIVVGEIPLPNQKEQKDVNE